MRSLRVSLRLLGEIVAIVAVAELLVMAALPWLVPQMAGWTASLLDVAVLVLLAAPAVYWRGASAIARAEAHEPEAAAGVHAEDAQAQRQAATLRRRRAVWMTAAAHGCGLLVTVLAMVYVKAEVEEDARQRFDRHADHLEAEVQRRFQLPVYGLNGIKGLAAATGELRPGQLAAWVGARDVPLEFPGVNGLGFVQRVARDELPRFVAAVRADGAPAFELRTQGQAAELYVVRMIEPLARNRPALGFDVGSEPLRREALERAIGSGAPALTAPITLGQGQRRGTGFIYFVPVYEGHLTPATVPERRRSAIGLAHAAIYADDLLEGVTRVADGAADIELLHRDAAGVLQVVLASRTPPPALTASAATPVPAPTVEATRTLAIGGREFTLRARATPAFEASIDRAPLLFVGLGGALLSLLAATTVWSLALGRLRAQTLADRMTADLDRLAQVVRHTSNAVIITDPQLRITWINEGFTRLSGHDLAAARGRTPGELLTSGSADAHTLARLADAVAQGRECRVEILNRRRDGRDYWVDLELQPLRDRRGRLQGFMQIGSDITAQRQANEELAAATRALTRERERLDNILQGTNVGTWEWNVQTNEALVNERWADMIGHTIESLSPITGSTWTRLVEPADLARARRTLQQHLSGQTDYYECELRLQHRGGHWVWVLTRGRVSTRSADGRPEWVAGTHMDITERKRAEERLREREHLMRLITDNMPGRMAYWDAQRRLVFGNRAFFEYFGGSADQCVGQGAKAVLGVQRARSSRDEVALVLQGQHQSFEREEQRPGGETAHVLTHLIPDERDGAVTGFYALTMDISFVKRAEAQLREANAELVSARDLAEEASRAKSRFVANMSHEIRTPMNAILGMLKLLQRTPLTQRQQDYADKAERAARALLGLLNDILDFSKVEAGKMTLDPRPFSLASVLRDLSVILTANLGRKPVALRFEQDPAVPAALVGDDLRLQQVLVNLAGNAVKFTERGEVVVSVRVVARSEHALQLQFVVADTGIGIAPEQQARIFDGFSQAESSTSRRFGGTGLGLSICVRLVGLMGGALQLESQPGQGSRFSFELSFGLAEPLAATERPALAAPAPWPLKGLRLLVVEDNAVNRQVAQELLEDEGAEVFLAEDGAAGVAAVAGATQPFDLVLMDVQMPVMDGYEATREIRKLPGAGTLPIVAMTANALASDRDASLAAGMCDHVGKPFELDLLVETILRHAGPAADAGRPAAPAAPAARRAVPSALPADALAWAGEQGIDLEGAVSRLGGRADIWSSTARGFAAELADQAPELQRLVSRGELPQASRLAHTLKGVGATVGASALSSAAAAAERLLKACATAAAAGAEAEAPAPLDTAPDTALDTTITTLLARMHEAAAALARLGDWLAPAPRSGADSVRDAPALLRALQPLKALLREQDMAATDLYAEIADAHAAHWAAELRPLADAMAALDFQAGVLACEQLALALGSLAEAVSA